ncbi:MAG: FecR domain-containing protein [Alphaproteobacteria bacterium]
MGTKHILLMTTALVAAMPAAVAAQDNAKIGVAHTVNPAARAIKVPGAQRVLFVGNELFQNERITTDAKGQVHVLFVDQSALTVGPNSDVVLDRYVFDPATNSGKASVSMTRGTLRFVGGKLSKTQDMDIKTPVATIGIRGGISIVQQQPNGSYVVVHMFGDKTTINNPDGTTTEITRRGYAVQVPGTGAPFEIPPEQLAEMMKALEGGTGTDTTDNKTFLATDDPKRLPSGDVPDWVYSLIATGDWYGFDLRRLDELLSLREGTNQTIRNIQLPPPPIPNYGDF